jgi:phage virion morphogenesis protein
MSKSGKLGPQIKEDQKQFRKAMRNILVVASNDAVNFFTENFKRGGFLDETTTKWTPRKSKKDKGRGVLIGKGGGAKLKNSISRSSISAKRAIIGIKGPAQAYASVHNFGLRSGRRSAPFTMPQRKFMGESKTLNKKILKLIDKKVKKAL